MPVPKAAARFGRAGSRAGRGETVDELARHHMSRLVRVAQRVTRDRDKAEDAVAAGLVIAVRRRDASESPTGLSWLLTVVSNEARRLMRRSAHEVPIEQTFQLAAPAADPDAVMDVRDALARLRPDERTALLGRMLGYSYDEISAAQGWTYTKVNRCVTEGRRALRKTVAA